MNAPLAPAVLLDVVRRAKAQRAAEGSLYEFVRQAWGVVEPGVPFVASWHIEVICLHLEAVTRGEIFRLLINIPPRHSKSTIVSVMWPMWEWIAAPEEKFLCASYSGALAVRDNLKARRLVQSPWYRERWGGVFRLAGDQNAKQRFENDRTGYRIATSVGGTATGEGGSRLVLDDPHGAQDAQSDAMRASALEWFDQVWSTRLNDPKQDAMVTIMQRLHEGDVSGHVIKDVGGWEHVCIPAEYDGIKRKTMLGAYDPRKQVGELICPERFGPTELARLKKLLGEYGTAGQLQQRPSPPGGGILKIKHFQLWPRKSELPTFEYIVQSYDGAYDDDATSSNDPSACTVWGVFQHGGRGCAMLLDAWAEHLGYPAFRKRVLAEWRGSVYGSTETGFNPKRGKRADAVLVEKKSSGISILQDLAAANVPAIPYDHGRASKPMRAHNIAPVLELDCLYIPESSKEPGEFVTWARPFVAQVEKFPNDEHDDFVDTFTQAMILLRDQGRFELDRVEDEDEDEVDYAAREKLKRNPYDA